MVLAFLQQERSELSRTSFRADYFKTAEKAVSEVQISTSSPCPSTVGGEPLPTPTHWPPGRMDKASTFQMFPGKMVFRKRMFVQNLPKIENPIEGKGNLLTHLKGHFPGRTF
jgi:hypothetical protein